MRNRHFRHVKNFDQIDSRAYLVHSWLKYPKFGHASATDYAARMVRYGLISRDEAVKLVQKHDYDLDPLCVRDFCAFCGYTETEFWTAFIIEASLTKDALGRWILKEPVYKRNSTDLYTRDA